MLVSRPWPLTRSASSTMPESRTDVIAGRNPVREALERGDGRIEKVLLQRGTHGSAIDAIRQAAKALGVPVQMVPKPKMDRVAPKTNHQGVVALAAPIAYADLDAMLSEIAPTLDAVKARKPVLVVLDGVEDPHNFGAILRSTVAAGASGALVPATHSAPLSAVAVKASAGAALEIQIARTSDLPEALHQLKERGYWVVGLDGGEAPGSETVSVWDYDWDRAVAIVVGSEGRGMRPPVRAACDVRIRIPIRGNVESLNASVAAGIALFAAVRRRD